MLTSDRETTIRMRVESSVPRPFMLFHSRSAKNEGRLRAHITVKGRGGEGRRGEGRRGEGREWEGRGGG